MNEKKVLIVYGTRFGSTEEVSQEIAKILNENGLKTDIIDLKKVKSKKWPPIDVYDGLIVGSSIKIGRWTKEPLNFLKKNRENIKNEKIKLGAFVCCATAADPAEIPKARKDYLDKTFEKLGLEPVLTDAFGGIMDFSKDSRMGFLEKKMAKVGYREEAKKQGKEDTINYEGKNDFRDWDQIKKFVNDFIFLLAP